MQYQLNILRIFVWKLYMLTLIKFLKVLVLMDIKNLLRLNLHTSFIWCKKNNDSQWLEYEWSHGVKFFKELWRFWFYIFIFVIYIISRLIINMIKPTIFNILVVSFVSLVLNAFVAIFRASYIMTTEIPSTINSIVISINLAIFSSV